MGSINYWLREPPEQDQCPQLEMAEADYRARTEAKTGKSHDELGGYIDDKGIYRYPEFL